jgi:hypothetical protein
MSQSSALSDEEKAVHEFCVGGEPRLSLSSSSNAFASFIAATNIQQTALASNSDALKTFCIFHVDGEIRGAALESQP